MYEKGNKENSKIEEVYRKELKVLVSQKLESDNRYHDIVKEREKFRETERILLNTFDFWKAKFDLDRQSEEDSKQSPPEPHIT